MGDLAFLTGMGRSGTTLVDRLLSAHPEIDFLSQPYPLMFVEIKARFLSDRGLNANPYPLSSYYGEPYTPEDFSNWLREYRLESELLETVFRKLKSYSGQMTQLPTMDTTQLIGLSLAEAMSVLLDAVRSPDGKVVGLKEVFCEEFVPYLISEGFKAMIVCRDPRDVMTSMRYGIGPKHIGAPRPLLFDLRNWRKSAEFVVSMNETARFFWLRYEDLIRDTDTVLPQCYEFLNVDSDLGNPTGHQSLCDGEGQKWDGNSSFTRHSGISDKSIGRHKQYCSLETISYIESICCAEMAWLHYSFEPRSLADQVSIVDSFVEELESPRQEFPPDFTSQANNKNFEIERLRSLRSGVSAAPHFVWKNNRPQLGSALAKLTRTA